ncbi:permease prefix domain 1-containing protein [Nitrospirillum sp. BR 11752]|uniref:permease prefix domain 1-containing protein n=1 Tax=Nitrospirillum sp. BR 11752 TaxID=3104293 RepID=UPI002EBCD96E|nr:permease prefix domain 1-containing protein [Nitrospirillum sp. BR 11752]
MFDRLRERLLTAGIAPRYARRYIAELREHASDLTEEEMASGLSRAEAETRALARLGTQEDLAQALLRRGDFRSWGARAPWAVYGIGAVLSVLATTILALGTLLAVIEIYTPAPDTPAMLPSWFGSAVTVISYGQSLALPLLIGAGFAILAARQRMPVLWPSLALLAVAVLGAGSMWHIQPPTTPDSQWSIGVGTMLLPLTGISVPPWGTSP